MSVVTCVCVCIHQAVKVRCVYFTIDTLCFLKMDILEFLVAQQVKDLVSLQWLGSLLWYRFDPWPWELPHAMGMAKKLIN